MFTIACTQPDSNISLNRSEGNNKQILTESFSFLRNTNKQCKKPATDELKQN